jgi:4-hydroxyphenylpyruvate dioxygenase-like putative hemolysin
MNRLQQVLESQGYDHRLELNHYKGHSYSAGDQLDHIAFEVENLNETLKELKAKGIEPVS